MPWADVWRYLRSWEGIVPTILTVAAALYYGPKKILEVWDWYLDRFWDREVLAILKNRIFISRTRPGKMIVSIEQFEPIESSYSADYIATQLNRSERSVSKSLKRLYAHDKIERYQDGWRLKP